MINFVLWLFFVDVLVGVLVVVVVVDGGGRGVCLVWLVLIMFDFFLFIIGWVLFNCCKYICWVVFNILLVNFVIDKNKY